MIQEIAPAPLPPAPPSGPAEAGQGIPASKASGPGPADRRRLTSIDGLRGLAILLVLLAHTIPGGIPERAAQSMPTRLLERFYGSGVELFCLISGLVSLRPFLLRLKPFNLHNYIKRRVQRLWPPYLVTLFLVAGPMAWLFTNYPTYYTAGMPLGNFSWTSWLSQIFIINWGNPLYIPAWWFLSIEMVFYALVPLLAVLAYRFQVSIAATWAILALSFIVGEIADRTLSYDFHGQGLLYLAVLFASYLPCHAAGIAVSRFDLSPRAGVALLGAGLGTIVVWSCLPVFNRHLGNALAFMGLAVLALATGTKVRRFLESYPMIWMGERSYSIFLIHTGILMLAGYLTSLIFAGSTPGYYLFSRTLGLPAALLASLLLFSLVERRFARGLITAGDFLPVGLFRRNTRQALSISSRIAS
jgi:peptidoglycan/LPS O-acetylase OafA/YrhL